MSNINIPEPRVCPFCGSPDLESGECNTGPHRRQLLCRTCNRHVRWLPRPLDSQQAREFAMPFGRFKGMKLGAIVAVPDCPRYLGWLMNQAGIGKPLQRRLKLVLEANPVKPGRA